VAYPQGEALAGNEEVESLLPNGWDPPDAAEAEDAKGELTLAQRTARENV
jgi:hypothetical protein